MAAKASAKKAPAKVGAAKKSPAKAAAKAQRPPAPPKPVVEVPAEPDAEPGRFPLGVQAQMAPLGETEPRIGVPEMHAPTEAAIATGRMADRFP